MIYAVLLLAMGIGIILWGYTIYRRFDSLKNRADRAWTDIHSLLNQRYDLIPELLEIVRESTNRNEDALERLAEAREAAMVFSDPSTKSSAENDLQQRLQTLFALAGATPDLKNHARFQTLTEELYEVEEKIQLARRYFNTLARDFNVHMKTFPDLLIARWFGLEERSLFNIGDLTQREPVQVRF